MTPHIHSFVSRHLSCGGNKESHIYAQRLLAAGSICLLLLFAYGCSAPASGETSNQATATSVAIATTNPLVVNSTLSKLQIKADIPPMQVKHQVLVAVSIYPTGGHLHVSDVPVVKNATSIVTNATPVGTPGKMLADAFGPDHSVIATATLVTSTDIFTVAPTGPQPKPLDQERVEWDWFVTPLVDGDQSIGVDIEVQWTSTANGHKSLPYTLGFPKFPVTVQPLPVTSTPPSPSTPDILAILNAVAAPLSTIIAAIIGLVGVFIALPGVRKRAKPSLSRSKKKPPAKRKAPATSDISETNHEEDNQQAN